MELYQLERPSRQLIHAKRGFSCYLIKPFGNVNCFRVGISPVRDHSGAGNANSVGLKKNKMH
jgi:hypothetical protein